MPLTASTSATNPNPSLQFWAFETKDLIRCPQEGTWRRAGAFLLGGKGCLLVYRGGNDYYRAIPHRSLVVLQSNTPDKLLLMIKAPNIDEVQAQPSLGDFRKSGFSLLSLLEAPRLSTPNP